MIDVFGVYRFKRIADGGIISFD